MIVLKKLEEVYRQALEWFDGRLCKIRCSLEEAEFLKMMIDEVLERGTDPYSENVLKSVQPKIERAYRELLPPARGSSHV